MFRLRNTVRRTDSLLYQSYDFPSLFVRMETIKDNLILTNLSSNDTIDIPSLIRVNLSYSFQFWFLLIFEIPSLICYFFVLIFILTQKAQRQALHNHSILVLLFISLSIVLFDYSWQIDSARRGGEVWLASAIFCEIWWLLDLGFYNASTVVLAWASFERHILIFHSNLLSTKRRILFIHYLPLIIILIYLAIFYTCAIFFPPCENQYDFTLPVCGSYPCYLPIPLGGLWDNVVHGIIPILFIALFNIALFVRILWQKRPHRHNWKKYQKMTFQLLLISAFHLSMNLPLTITVVAHLVGYPEWGVQAENYFYFFGTLVQFLLPFVILTYLPGIWLKMKTLFGRNHRRIEPKIAVRAVQVQQQETKL